MTASASTRAQVTGRLLVLPGTDIDTDRIMPARFLKAITFTGLEQHVFADDRAAARASGQVHPFDEPAHAGASILVAGPNFGCGSSREHAPQALQRWGIQAVVSPSFAEIFAGNATTIGLICAGITPDAYAVIARDPAGEWHLDLDHLTLSRGTHQLPLQLPDSRRHALRSGEWDATGLLLDRYDEVMRVDARLPYFFTASKNA
jgi:3-isopropylmalate/(R)-2-methylmalate dehydratase small subunit